MLQDAEYRGASKREEEMWRQRNDERNRDEIWEAIRRIVDRLDKLEGKPDKPVCPLNARNDEPIRSV